MGLISFIKNAGAKVFGKGKEEKEADRIELIKSHIQRYGFLVEDMKVDVAGEKITIAGKVDSLAVKNKILVAAGNIEGISEVDDLMVVKQAEVAEPEKESRFYTVKKGDYLSKIAKEMYGDASKYPIIFEANKPMLKDPDLIYPGQVLIIPEL
ncbi:MAG: peptidoglycan-binding protein LysM [Bacteroidales bacterium]|jgi:nucleoid-associated protein YgaU|nr:peptidoglycan-binding protein LysM [Bacteroidales bacterium]NLM93527.1 peptidoglycan-binding protein LysM [Bacteroidales bacterium]